MNTYAKINLSRVFVTCPICGTDIRSPSRQEDWTLAEVLTVENVTEHSECPMCHECGEFLVVVLPEMLEVDP